MKKLLSIAAVSLALCGLFVGCASNGGAKKSAGPSVSIPHPRAYEVDPADGCDSIEVAYNQYGPNYQAATPNLWKLLKADKPQAGDTVNLKMKITSDTDIPALTYYLIDNSPAANYWGLISDDYVVEGIKAGEAVEVSQEIVLTDKTKGGFQVILCYDGADHGQDKYPKVGKVATLTFEKIGNTTDTAAEIAALQAAAGVETEAAGPKTINIQIDSIAGFCEIATNHPWVDGVQDMSRIENYAATVGLDTVLEDVLEAGDVINVSWNGVSDRDIEVIYCRPVDHSQEVGWWNELLNLDWSNKDLYALARDIKAGEPFTANLSFTLDKASVSTDVILNIWYDYDPETNGPGPSLILKNRNN